MLEVEVRVIISQDIGDLYTKSDPGQVILQIDQPSLERTVALGQLCGKDTEGPRDIFEYDANGIGCPEKGTLLAWITDFDDEPICDRSDEWLEAEEHNGPKPADPQAMLAFWENTDCESLIEPFELRLVLPDPLQ